MVIIDRFPYTNHYSMSVLGSVQKLARSMRTLLASRLCTRKLNFRYCQKTNDIVDFLSILTDSMKSKVEERTDGYTGQKNERRSHARVSCSVLR